MLKNYIRLLLLMNDCKKNQVPTAQLLGYAVINGLIFKKF